MADDLGDLIKGALGLLVGYAVYKAITTRPCPNCGTPFPRDQDTCPKCFTYRGRI